MNPDTPPEFRWSQDYENFNDGDDDFCFQKDIFKKVVLSAGLPPFETTSMPHEVWDSFGRCDDRSRKFSSQISEMLINAMVYFIKLEKPNIDLSEIAIRPGGHEKTLTQIYEAALRKGYGTNAQRGAALMDDIGL
ncbi:hypothetical protein [Pseudomonas sp. ES3-33]|uniref:hypothetical protein n=1 Tax=Pseudomonas sp. ES3-33 TaxID=1628833 RepID=UPI0005D42CFB|nr:hypothetical protein [Pseudomonas sp. ES3-33]KJH79028.1 hypothetical protein UB23_00400 [Pseudomonas sp. ES3-33]